MDESCYIISPLFLLGLFSSTVQELENTPGTKSLHREKHGPTCRFTGI